MSESPILGITELEAAQSQPEIPVNTAFRKLEAYAQLIAISRSTTNPPGSPSEGDRYIVPAFAQGVWANHEFEVALCIGGGWEFLQPLPGWFAYIADEDLTLRFTPGSPTAWVPDSGAPVPAGRTVGTVSPLEGGGPLSADLSLSIQCDAGEIIGRSTAGFGAAERITVGAGLQLTGGVLQAAGGGGPSFSSSISANPGAAENNYNPSGWDGGDGVSRLLLTPAGGGSTITGLDATNTADGQSVAVFNDSDADNLTFTNAGAGSTAASRFLGPGAGDVVVAPREGVILVYVTNRWRFA